MTTMNQLFDSTMFFGGNAPFVEELYENYLDNPTAVPAEWRDYFDRLAQMPGYVARDVAHAPVVAAFAELARDGGFRPVAQAAGGDDKKQVSVLQLINAYRILGTRWAELDPLKRMPRPAIHELELPFYGFSDADLNQTFNVGSFKGTPENAKLGDIVAALRETYCGSVGVEYMYMSDYAEKRWLQERLETIRSRPTYGADQKKRLLERLTAAETLERYLHTKYVGQKRFSLEGGESLIVSMDEAIRSGGVLGVDEIVIGMAHRGRLNVLVNTLGKAPSMLFDEFEGKKASDLSAGDVKYHMGYSSDVSTPGGPCHLTLSFNPSHLEIVNPVVEGSVYARQLRRGAEGKDKVLPVLIHGDAAVAGQGVNQEMLNFAQTRGYGTGGTVHIVVNNQIGFTTSDPRDYRSGHYCTDIFKMADAPIFHVNGDDPEAVALVTQLAIEFRQEFKQGCRRRHRLLPQARPQRAGRADGDAAADVQEDQQASGYAQALRRQAGRRGRPGGRRSGPDDRRVPRSPRQGRAALQPGPGRLLAPERDRLDAVPDQGLHRELRYDGAGQGTAAPLRAPDHDARRISRCTRGSRRSSMTAPRWAKASCRSTGAWPRTWPTRRCWFPATACVFPARMSGAAPSSTVTLPCTTRIARTGTREPTSRCKHLQEKQARFQCFDSVLSEEAVLAFDYGYATANPYELVVWEAQFGDFANGAQVVIDQFIASGEAKWGRACGLVMLLPHGYEGQGPEHSSARIERFMQLCAEMNMEVCVPSTAAQVFHMLRRQGLRKQRKPLIVMSPKSLLRHKDACSSLEELAKGQFQPVIGEVDKVDAKKVTRVVFCAGKIYYDLVAARRERKIANIAIARVEQLYPFPKEHLEEELAKYPKATEIVWCQEEPRNQGAWYWIASRHHLDTRSVRSSACCWCRGRPRRRRRLAIWPSTTSNKRH